ncbi:metallophosphoesterase family protein [Marinobacterium sedimentorum]|uniref:metallophosphoesterase family protein n=1 Tax=Marinobacterium sedimentorum TaxID=2927804 RepID=UPI0020C6DBD7|nr:metallophosphoesterase family protein [Marinobacterium sedimentorum]MCP8690113.1 metallophosphoesterase [Marinobacterium sedimentorum]
MNAQTDVRDLGALTGPVMIFGGPYSNLQATRALLDAANRLGLPANQLVCTGDAVAYCADTEATVRLLRDAGMHWIQGNCEQSLGNRIDDCGCGFEEGSSCATLSDSWYSYANRTISEDSRAWLRTLPAQLRFTLNGRRIQVVHGAADQINRFVFESTPQDEKQRQLDLVQADVVVGGHCGLPFGQAWHSGAWLNAGVIGMPANDGTKDGWYMLLIPEAERLKVSWHRLNYAATEAADAMRFAGLPTGYSDALLSGLWPSIDILPTAERRRRGQPLQLAALLI